MNNNTGTMQDANSIGGTIFSRVFGIIFFVIGIINIFWGKDGWFGVFIIMLSLIYLLPVHALIRRTIGESVPKIGMVKILVGIFIIWAAVGVGELFEKIELMLLEF